MFVTNQEWERVEGLIDVYFRKKNREQRRNIVKDLKKTAKFHQGSKVFCKYINDKLVKIGVKYKVNGADVEHYYVTEFYDENLDF